MIINKIIAGQNYNTKINKSLNNPHFGNKNMLQKGAILGATTITASELFAEATKEIGDPSEIIKEFYENENLRYTKTPKIGVNLDRFSQEDKYEILKNADEIKLATRTFGKIVNAKNSKNEYRFSTDESLNLFLNTRNKIKNYPEIFKAILNAKNDDNTERFNSKDCIVLMNYAEKFDEYPNSFKAILEVNDLNANECKEFILRAKHIEPNMTTELLKKAYEENKDIKNSHDKIKKIANDIKDNINAQKSNNK